MNPDPMRRLIEIVDVAKAERAFPSPIACNAVEDQLIGEWKQTGNPAALYLGEVAALAAELQAVADTGKSTDPIFEQIERLLGAALGCYR